MPYAITAVEYHCWPNPDTVERALATFGLSIRRLIAVLSSCSHAEPPRSGVGFQLDLAPTLQHHLSSTLIGNGLHSVNSRYSPRLNEKADLALARDSSSPRLFVEIEFRSNVEKDLMKFQIGANAGTLAAAVLILTSDRTCVNAAYTTMPEFYRIARVITELRPAYPLILLGFRGTHR